MLAFFASWLRGYSISSSHRRRARRCEIVTGVLCADQLGRFEAEAVALNSSERSRSLTARVIRSMCGLLSCLSPGAR
jgi:hypothetical protein